MTDKQSGIVARAVTFVADVANRRHALSKLVPFGLWVVDAILCALIIWKVPCKRQQPYHFRLRHDCGTDFEP